MEYLTIIADRLISVYERRGLYDSTTRSNKQAVYLNIAKEFPEYKDLYDDAYQEINNAIDYLIRLGVLVGERDERGSYQKLRLNLEQISVCYELTGKSDIGLRRHKLNQLLSDWNTHGSDILSQFRKTQLQRLESHKSIEFGIGDDIEKLNSIMRALSALVNLESETYIRNFSEMVFSDSKKFQKIQSCVESILCKYGGQELTKKTVLETFNLLKNPSYINLKGNLQLQFGEESFHIRDIPGGIALPSIAIPAITEIRIHGSSLITVENLTTYHDEQPEDNAVIYLGGFHNSVRTNLLLKIHQDNPAIAYYHKGDIDAYGFLILENLKSKTSIPFQPLEMDLDTLREYEAYHLTKPLDAADRKLLHAEQLASYSEILEYMGSHNCKAEQESRQALALLRGK